MKYLALDVGAKNIGVATGEILASELTTIHAPKNLDFYQEAGRQFAITEIERLLNREQSDAIVIGLPVDDKEQMTKEATLIKEFGEALGKAVDKKIHYVNETLTTFMAEDMLTEQGLSAEEVKERTDQLCAQLILQQFLESDEGL